jgi:four helix bundle protein
LLRFEDLEVWKRSARLSADIYKELSGLKDYGFKDQITRSGLSIPSNIAEGMERVSRAECVKFLLYSKGSCGELRTQIYIGMDIAYIEKETGKNGLVKQRPYPLCSVA